MCLEGRGGSITNTSNVNGNKEEDTHGEIPPKTNKERLVEWGLAAGHEAEESEGVIKRRRKKGETSEKWTNYLRQRMTGLARRTRSIKKNHHVGDTVPASSAAFEANRVARESSIVVACG